MESIDVPIQVRQNSSQLLIAVPMIILINVAVFLIWSFPSEVESEPRFLINNFLVSWTGLVDGRIWTLVTSVFSHVQFWHIFLNMYVLAGFGPVMERNLGSGRFVRFYLLAGIISSFTHAVVSAWVLQKPDLPALGASGAVSAVIVLFALFYPKRTLLLFGIIPISAIWAAALFVGLDFLGLAAQARGSGLPIGHGAHLGGAATAIIYYFFYIRPRLSEYDRAI